MRALLSPKLGAGLDSFSIGELPNPTPGQGEALVRVHAVSLNSADLKTAEWRDGASFIHGKGTPVALGYDVSGIVEALGPGATGVSVGDAVFGFIPYASSTKAGTLAELAVVSVSEVTKKPDGVGHAEAAAAGTAAVTALQVLRDKGSLVAGQRVLIHGASGGVGSFAVQVAKKLGAEVTATCSGAKAPFVKGLGADVIVDYRQTPVADLDGGFDIAFDAASKSSFAAMAPKLNAGGTYATLLPSLSFVTGKLRSLLSSKRCEFLAVKSRPADLELLGSWLADGSMRSAIGLTVSFDETVEGLRQLKAGKIEGKVVVEVVA